MNDNAFQWAFAQKTGSPTTKHVLVVLAFHSDVAGTFSRPQAALAKVTGLAERTVRKALKQLEVGGFLTRTPARTPDEGRCPDLIHLTMKREG